MADLKHTPCDCAEWKRLNDACADLMAERDYYRAALQDIADDPIIDPRTDMRRGIADILRIARNALDAMQENPNA